MTQYDSVTPFQPRDTFHRPYARIKLHSGAIFPQSLVFVGIAQQGYFMAVEQNIPILVVEVAITAFALVYFLYIYRRLVRSVK